MHTTRVNLTNGLSALCYKHDEVNKMKVAEGKRGQGGFTSSGSVDAIDPVLNYFSVSNPNFDVESEYGMFLPGCWMATNWTD